VRAASTAISPWRRSNDPGGDAATGTDQSGLLGVFGLFDIATSSVGGSSATRDWLPHLRHSLGI
jgi:hypothetical protein